MGVDPGATSGIAVITGKRSSGMLSVDLSEAKSLLELYNTIMRRVPDILVVERFISTFRYSSRNVVAPLMAIGVCGLISEIMDIKFVWSNPSLLQGKRKPSKNPHQWSAEIHARHYWEKNIASVSR